jgi:osmoprotectant transport system permease protein
MKLEHVTQHIYLVLMAGLFTIVFGLIFGIIAYLFPKIRKYVIFVFDLFQTIPTLATLGLLMVVFGASPTTVIVGLTLYNLLPVVRNTMVGLMDVSPAIKEAAEGMGMPKMTKLLKVELPLAFPLIFAGMRISLVNSIGSAVMGFFVGGGGLGSVLYRGIRTMNFSFILQGTLTLMAMAIVVDGVMSFYENKLLPKNKKGV